MKILDGKALQQKCIEQLKPLIANLQRPPKLTAVLVGDDAASKRYVHHKTKACEKAGILSEILYLDEKASSKEIKQVITTLSQDDLVDGILLQLPLPNQDPNELIDAIDPKKDVDGLTPQNMGKLLLGRKDGLTPCTPKGIWMLLQEYKIETKAKRVVIVGRSNIVGKPLANLLLQKNGANATVTVAHSGTTNLKEICMQADILIAAIGKPKFITKEFVKPEACVIDVGINEYQNDNGVKLIGDVDFDSIQDIAGFISPVPGGIGPMTIAALLQNTYLAHIQRISS